ncbi:MAG: hypothetical protein ABI624_23100 [Casimicrobiaceae bacterium]
MVQSIQAARARCEPMGRLEYVVESRHHGLLETWYVVRAHHGSDGNAGIASGRRLVVEAESLRPLGVLDSELREVPDAPAGYNPYFDLPPA